MNLKLNTVVSLKNIELFKVISGSISTINKMHFQMILFMMAFEVFVISYVFNVCFSGIERRIFKNRSEFLHTIQHIEIQINRRNECPNLLAILDQQLPIVQSNAHFYIFTDCTTINDSNINVWRPISMRVTTVRFFHISHFNINGFKKKLQKKREINAFVWCLLIDLINLILRSIASMSKFVNVSFFGHLTALNFV